MHEALIAEWRTVKNLRRGPYVAATARESAGPLLENPDPSRRPWVRYSDWSETAPAYWVEVEALVAAAEEGARP